MCIGVCDSAGVTAYGFAPYCGRLSSLTRAAPGKAVEGNSCPPAEHEGCTFTRELMAEGLNLKGRATGAVLEFIVDADAGSVALRINAGPPVIAISGLPHGVRLRPFVRLFERPDRVTMSGFWTPC